MADDIDRLDEETREELVKSLDNARKCKKGDLLTYEEVFGSKPPRKETADVEELTEIKIGNVIVSLLNFVEEESKGKSTKKLTKGNIKVYETKVHDLHVVNVWDGREQILYVSEHKISKLEEER